MICTLTPETKLTYGHIRTNGIDGLLDLQQASDNNLSGDFFQAALPKVSSFHMCSPLRRAAQLTCKLASFEPSSFGTTPATHEH